MLLKTFFTFILLTVFTQISFSQNYKIDRHSNLCTTDYTRLIDKDSVQLPGSKFILKDDKSYKIYKVKKVYVTNNQVIYKTTRNQKFVQEDCNFILQEHRKLVPGNRIIIANN